MDYLYVINYIDNMLYSLTVDDKAEIFKLVENQFQKLENLKINGDKNALKLAIYRTVYKRSGIVGFVNFWQKYKQKNIL